MKIQIILAMMLIISGYASAKNAMHIVINDHLGTPQMLVDENRNVVWKAEYDEFGKANILVEKVQFNLRFPGQYYDKETGLHYNYYRDYDPALGRYVQSDPIGLGGGINTYGYVDGNPVNLFDILGLNGEKAAEWAKQQESSKEYQWWDKNKESKGKKVNKLGGSGAPKCNAFVWDGLVAGGNPPPRMPNGNIPTTSDWYNNSVTGYDEVPLESAKKGDVIVTQKSNTGYGHMGIYYPLNNSSDGTVSAGTATNILNLIDFINKNQVLHNDWGFRDGQKPKAFRCECDM